MWTALLLCALQTGGPAAASTETALPLQPPPADRLLQVLADPTAPQAARLEALADLALGGEPLPAEALLPLRNQVPASSLPDYARCLGRSDARAGEILRKLLEHKDPEVRAEALYALVRLDPAAGPKLARGTAGDGGAAVVCRVAALRALADADSPFARVEALRHLAAAEGPFLLECLAVLRRRPDLEDVPYLIPLLERGRGRAAWEAVALLQRITGYKIGLDARTWDYFRLKHVAEGTPFRRTDPPDEAATETLSYLGVPITSDRIVFVLDSSGSMNEALPEQPRHTRGSMAVEELIHVLPRLAAGARFDIVFFTDRAAAYGGGRLTPRDEEHLTQASGWLRNRRFDGSTNLGGGLELAFAHPEVDEIVLLSDGEPTAGETRPHRILGQVARWNRWRHVRLSTISLGAPPAARALLYKLADQNGGVCRILE